MTDANQSFGQNVDQESAEKLFCGNSHNLLLAAVGIILPSERHSIILEANESMVGDRDAVGIAREIMQNMFGAAEGWLGVDDPVLSEELSQKSAEGTWFGESLKRAVELELVLLEELSESRGELASKDATECTDGRRNLDEFTLDQLGGYEKSAPVRIGNAAHQQFQLDIYGEMMDSIYLANKYGDAVPYAGWLEVQRLLAWLGNNWQRPDQGIWEVRGGAREFLQSRFMCWVAFDRGIRLAQKRSLSAPLQDWLNTRDAIREDIFTNFWNEELQSFVQSKGSKDLDASVLLMPLMRFISPVDPLWLSTLRAIESRLVEDTLVHRYEAERTHVDGIPGGEGSFTACSFWYIECLTRAGQLEKAQLLFEKMLGYANHLGLYSEQLGSNGQHLGNFPQAFTHLALISAATYLDRMLSGENEAVWR